MAFNRQGTGLMVVRVCLGVFLIAEGLSKVRWLFNSSILAGTLNEWLQAAAYGSATRWYLEHVAIPGTVVFARLVPVGELACGFALLFGMWTTLFASLAFLMVLNFHLASGGL